MNSQASRPFPQGFALAEKSLCALATSFLSSPQTDGVALFRQTQVEFPDTWLTHGNPWEVQRLDITYPVTFYGNEKVIAVAYDTPIPGYDTLNTNSLRLWSAMPDQDIDLGKFNEGDYSKALAARQRALEITQVGVTATCFAAHHHPARRYVHASIRGRTRSFFSTIILLAEMVSLTMAPQTRCCTPMTTTGPAKSFASSSSTSSCLLPSRT